MIRPAGSAHAAALAAIHAEAFSGDAAWGPDAMALQLALPGTFALIAPEGGMALARATAGEAEILTFAVVPAARRRGLGTALLAALRREAACRGAGTLFLEVSSRNGAARGLYSAAGFVEIGRRRRYYPDGADALVLRLPLSREERPPCGSAGA